MISKNGSTDSNSQPVSSQQLTGMTMVPLSIDGAARPDDKSDEGLKIQPHQLWAAFCRHWFLSIVLGLMAAAPVAYLVWKHVPTPYKAEAAVEVRTNRHQVTYELAEDRQKHQIIKSREMYRATHPDTIDRALRDGGIADFATFEAVPIGMTKTYWLRKKISVSNRGEELFTVSLEGERPAELRDIVNAVKDAYFAELQDKEDAVEKEQTAALETRIKKYERIRETKQREIQMKAREVDGSFDEDAIVREDNLRKRTELQAEIREIDRVLIELRAYLASYQNQLSDDPSDTKSAEDGDSTENSESLTEKRLLSLIKLDQRYRNLEATINQLKRDRERWKRAFGTEDVEEIKDIDRDLVQLEKKKVELVASLKDEYRQQSSGAGSDPNVSMLTFRIQGLEVHKKDVQKELAPLMELEADPAQEKAAIELADLRDELETINSIIRRMEQQKEEFEIEEPMNQVEAEHFDRIREYYPAELPTERQTRKRDFMTAGAGLGTFGFVVALFTLLELRFMRVSSLKLLENEFDLPILGTIPRLPVKVLQNQQNTRKAAVYKHTFTEAIDSARTVLLNQQKKNPVKILMVTSALGGEGKSTLSSHLAISFARAGRKTLLIDGDLRRPRVHDVFQIPDFPGFCETLRGETPVEKCIYESGVAGLDIMPAGELDAFTLRMLAEPETHQLFTNLRNEYDLVLFDSSPVLPVADSLLIMQSIDGVLLSIRKDHSRMSKVSAALKKIELVGGRVLGGIVIGINEAEYGYGASYYGTSKLAQPVATGTESSYD